MGKIFSKDSAQPEGRPVQTGPDAGLLHLAVQQGQTALVRQLCSKSSTNVNHKVEGVTPLMAALNDAVDTEIFRILLRCSRLDVNLSHDAQKFTPLMLAVLFSAKCTTKAILYKKIELLTAHKHCKLGLQNENGVTALEIAAKVEDAFLVKLLIKGDRFKQYGMPDLLGACAFAFGSRNDELIHALLDNLPQTLVTALLIGLKQHATGERENDNNIGAERKSYSLTALHEAVVKESVSEVKRLLDQPSTDVNADVGGLTPLMLAVCGRSPAVVKLLLSSSRIDINAKSPAFKNMTALMMSIFACRGASDPVRITIINQLLAHPECDFTLKDEDNISALGLASIFGFTDAADCLLREQRVDKYASEDFAKCVLLTVVTNNEDLGKYMCGKASDALQAEMVEKLPKLDEKAEVSRQLTAHVELGKSLNHTIKSLRLGKPVVGSVVRIVKDEQFVKGKQAEHSLTFDSGFLNRIGIVHKFTPGGDAAILLNANIENIVVCHPDILSVLSREKYEGIDEDGNVLVSGDVVKVTQDLHSLNQLQKGHGGVDDDHRAALGKLGRIMFFDGDGDALVTVGSDNNCLNPKALRKVTTVTSGDGSTIKVGDKVRVLHSETAFKDLQTLECGGWTSPMSQLMGKTLTVTRFCCSASSDPKCLLEVEYDSRSFRLNPKAVGLTDLIDTEETIVHVPRATAEDTSPFEEPISPNPLTASTDAPDMQQLLINRRDLKLGKKLGDGRFGMYYFANWGTTECAVKRIVSSDVLEGDEKQRILDEARILSHLTHPHVVQFLGIALDEIDIFLAFKLIHGHNLEEITFENKMALSETEKRTICTEISDALRYFHDTVGLIHQDLKPSNVLVDAATKHAFVTDFGISRMKGRTAADVVQLATQRYATEMAGTIIYMAPEFFVPSPVEDNKLRRNTKESDIYALGVTLVEFLGNVRFFESADIVSVVQMKTKPGIPASVRRVPSAFRVVLTKCVQPNPEDRPTARVVAEYFLQAE